MPLDMGAELAAPGRNRLFDCQSHIFGGWNNAAPAAVVLPHLGDHRVTHQRALVVPFVADHDWGATSHRLYSAAAGRQDHSSAPE